MSNESKTDQVVITNIPVGVALGADQASHFAFANPRQSTWQENLRRGLTTAFCVVTDYEVLGPYETFEEAESLIDGGMSGDVFNMRYQ